MTLPEGASVVWCETHRATTLLLGMVCCHSVLAKSDVNVEDPHEIFKVKCLFIYLVWKETLFCMFIPQRLDYDQRHLLSVFFVFHHFSSVRQINDQVLHFWKISMWVLSSVLDHAVGTDFPCIYNAYCCSRLCSA